MTTPKLSEAQRRALTLFEDGQEYAAVPLARQHGIHPPTFARTLRILWTKEFLYLRWTKEALFYGITPAGRQALKETRA